MCEACSSKALLLPKQLFMTLNSMTESFDLATARTGRRWDCVRVMALSLVVTGSFLLQGCLAGAWVAMVAVDSMRSSNVTFEPFEQSWVAQQDQSNDAAHLVAAGNCVACRTADEHRGRSHRSRSAFGRSR